MNLIIITKKFGNNYTGATIATQNLIRNWILFFENIEVFCIDLGNYQKFSNLKVHHCKNQKEMINNIRRIKDCNTIFYSDDHLGYILDREGKKYYHTYHGNWPDARKINFDFYIKSFYFIHMYKKTISGATNVINVSDYMSKFTNKYNTKCVTIRNGIRRNKQLQNNDCIKNSKKCMLIGNIDNRKYKKAIPVLKKVFSIDKEIVFDIYGNIDNNNLAKKLLKIGNVNLNGYVKDIPYQNYNVMICTSIIENLPLSICECLVNDVPVISFNVGGISEVVKDKVNGFLVDKFDISEMSEIIIDFFRKNKKMRNINLDDFDWEKSSKKYLNLFMGDII